MICFEHIDYEKNEVNQMGFLEKIFGNYSEKEIKKVKLELKELFAKDKELDAKIMEILNSDD